MNIFLAGYAIAATGPEGLLVITRWNDAVRKLVTGAWPCVLNRLCTLLP